MNVKRDSLEDWEHGGRDGMLRGIETDVGTGEQMLFQPERGVRSNFTELFVIYYRPATLGRKRSSRANVRGSRSSCSFVEHAESNSMGTLIAARFRSDSNQLSYSVLPASFL